MKIVFLSLAVCSTAYMCAGESWLLPIGEAEPLEAKNVSFEEGPFGGRAVHVATNGVIRYAIPREWRGYAPKGSVSVWFKQDWTPIGASLYRDRDSDFDGSWTRPLWQSVWLRTLLRCGTVGMGGGIFGTVSVRKERASVQWRSLVYEGDWHNLTMTWMVGGSLCAYLDGVLRAKKPVKATEKIKFGPAVSLGFGDYEYGLGGTIGSVEFFREALEAKTVNALVAQVNPKRTEMLDWSATVGEKKSIRFRTLDLRTGERAEYVREVMPEKAGLFRLHENGTTFELVALEKADKGNGAAAASSKPTLLCSYDCTKEYSTNVWNDCGSHIVTNGTLVYREVDEIVPGCGVMYRAKVRHPGKRHIVEIDFPDDARRDYSLAVHHVAFGVLHCGTLDCAGIITGVDYPLSNEMRTKRLVVWPDGDEVALMVYGYRVLPASRPPAVAAVRFYEDGDVPLVGTTGADKRTVGHWDEDPSMDANQAHMNPLAIRNANLESWRIKWERIVERMKWQGLNAWNIQVVSYEGDVTFMNATFDHFSKYALCDGRCPGWAELGADILSRNGFDFYCRLNDRPYEWFVSLCGVDDAAKISFGTKGRGKRTKHALNFLRPEVQAAYTAEIRAYRDKFRVYPHFRGITMNEAWGIRFEDLSVGYDDYTIGLFEKESGVRVPSGNMEARQAFLTAPERRGRWLDWRSGKVEEILRSFVAILRERGDDKLELQYWIPARALVKHMGDWPNADLADTYREQGIDLAALNNIPGLRVVPCVRPDYFRTHVNRFDLNEPYYNLSPEESALFNGKGLSSYGLFLHANLEIFPNLAVRKSHWKWPMWTTPALYARNQVQIYDFAPPHPVSEWTTELIAHILAEYDVQDLWHGWWGITESGEHDAYRRFYNAYTSIPRGRFDVLADWTNDPIAIRTAKDKGWYAVNRLAFPVTLKGRNTDGTLLSFAFGPHEVKYFGSDWQGVAKSLSAELSAKARTYFADIRRKLDAIENAGAGAPQLKEVLSRMTAAEKEGRWGLVRALHLTEAARAARLAAPTLVSPRLDFDTKEIVLRVMNFDSKPYAARFRIAKCKGKNLRAVEPEGKSIVIAPGQEGEVRLGLEGRKTIRYLGSGRITIVAEQERESTEYVFSFFSEMCAKWVARNEMPNLGRSRTLTSRLPEEAKDAGLKGRLERLEAKIGKGNRLTCRYALMAAPDASGLRFVAEVENPEFVPPTDLGKLYKGDSIQLYFDQQNLTQSNGRKDYADGVVILQLGLLKGARPTAWLEHPANRLLPEVDLSVESRDGKLIYDAFIPKSVLSKARIAPGECIGMGILVNDYMTDAEGVFSTGGLFGKESPFMNPASWRHYYFR